MTDPTTERAAWCALNTIFGFEPMTGHALVRAAGGAAAVFSLRKEELRAFLGPSRLCGRISRKALDDAARGIEDLSRKGYRFHSHAEPSYPDLLRECEDPPLGLYVRSDTPPEGLFPKGRAFIAVVGTRDLTPYGNEWCRKIVCALAATADKPVIVSGLALGTDAVAHQTALECGLATIGVMATGIDGVYPHRHEALADRMAAAPGSGLITDFPPGTAPLAVHFLRRNRIIAGLCRAVILTESKVRGGGMTTARLAASYNRDVLALPGRADDLRSTGCNLLIREKVAEPLTDLDALPAQLGLAARGRKGAERDLPSEIRARYAGSLPQEEVERLVTLACLIREHRGISTEELCRESGAGWPQTAAGTALLEADGIIGTDLFGNCFIKPKNV